MVSSMFVSSIIYDVVTNGCYGDSHEKVQHLSSCERAKNFVETYKFCPLVFPRQGNFHKVQGSIAR